MSVSEDSHLPKQAREYRIAELHDLCRRLNRAGADPQWSKASLDRFINELYDVEDGTDSLGGASIDETKQYLLRELKMLEATTEAEVSLYGNGARKALERSVTSATTKTNTA